MTACSCRIKWNGQDHLEKPCCEKKVIAVTALFHKGSTLSWNRDLGKERKGKCHLSRYLWADVYSGAIYLGLSFGGKWQWIFMKTNSFVMSESINQSITMAKYTDKSTSKLHLIFVSKINLVTIYFWDILFRIEGASSYHYKREFFFEEVGVIRMARSLKILSVSFIFSITVFIF